MDKVALTFDDGPNEPYTSKILDILSGYLIKSIFFVCGRNVEFHPESLRRIVQEGHLLGNHTHSHSRFLTVTGLALWETFKAAEVIRRITGIRPEYFRPPYGARNPFFWWYLKRKGYRVVLWDVDGRDWERPSAAELARRIVARVKPNSVVLLHDGHNTIHGDDRSPTVEALPLIIEGLMDRGYVFVRLDEL
ncbi:MAG: polysaccharide deacetylase [Dehalococcoidia bacterium]|nr:polysaccharide deacetylase [Dehalococcoidia bacterium]